MQAIMERALSMPRTGLMRVTRLFTMPQDGAGAMADLLATARRSLDIKAFKFSSDILFEAVAAAVRRGVTVRVLLNPALRTGERPNDAASERLRRDGALVAWTGPAFSVTHEKSVVIDGARALIATFNLTDRDLGRTRDYGVLLDEPAAVASIAACFEADWNRVPFTPPWAGSLVFDSSARAAMAALIDGAVGRLRIQHPKYCDMTIVDCILAAHARGVRIRILCGGGDGLCEADRLDTCSALRTFDRAGIEVRRQCRLKPHAKLIVADRTTALVGSMNIHRDAFDRRRELGVLVADPLVIHALLRQFRIDWSDAPSYSAPDPMLFGEPPCKGPASRTSGKPPRHPRRSWADRPEDAGAAHVVPA